VLLHAALVEALRYNLTALYMVYLDVAGYIMLGYKNDDISTTTKYTLNTVKSYRKDLYSKLAIHETRELFLRASKLLKSD
jgi:DNA-binding NarL/FixJ family response regulator